MRAINISNTKNRNAEVGFEVKGASKDYKFVLPSGISHNNIRLLKSTIATGLSALTAIYGDDLSDVIITSDVEVDMEKAGMFISGVKKIFIDENNRPAYRITRKHLFHSPGNDVELKEITIPEANINVEIPVRCTGKLIPRSKAIRSFVFARNYQIKHINGLTFDFLYDMAKTLHESDSMMLLGAGASGKNPLVMSSGGTSYRAFLEGRIDGNRYALILHLTNLELKPIQ